jgi:hypothetical protein
MGHLLEHVLWLIYRNIPRPATHVVVECSRDPDEPVVVYGGRTQVRIDSFPIVIVIEYRAFQLILYDLLCSRRLAH